LIRQRASQRRYMTLMSREQRILSRPLVREMYFLSM